MRIPSIFRPNQLLTNPGFAAPLKQEIEVTLSPSHHPAMSFSRRAGAALAAFISAPPCRRIPGRLLAVRSASTAPSIPSPATAAANTAQVSHDLSPSDESQPLRSLTDGLEDPPPVLDENEKQVDWTRSYHGLSSSPFSPEQAEILQAPLDYDDIEIKPDGIVYLPEIKYRRRLNRAFGPGGWGLAPRGETIVTAKVVTREYGLVCGGRYAEHLYYCSTDRT